MKKTFKIPEVSAASLLGNFGADEKPDTGFSFDLGDAGSLDLTPPPTFKAPAPIPSSAPTPVPSGDPLVRTLQGAGFKGDALRTAWAIAKRESGGRADAYNPDRSTGDDSYGLFQINMLGKLGPARMKQYGLKSYKDLLDPATNARVAYAMSKGGKDFGAWGLGPNAYRSGAGFDTIKKYWDEFPKVAAPPKGTASVAPVAAVVEGDSVGANAVRMAATQLGKPYVFGSGPDTSSFDCSDLVQWSYKQLGINVPRDTWGQQKALPLKPWSQLRVGDPIYRRSGGHVVIYAGNGKVIAAPRTGKNVEYQPLSNFPQDKYEVRSVT